MSRQFGDSCRNINNYSDEVRERILKISSLKVSNSRPVSKYRAERTFVNGIPYHSKREAAFAVKLNILRTVGKIKFYLRQVGFDLPGNVRHFVDFLVFYSDGTYKFIEVKGRDLPLGKMKRKQVESLYNLKIEVV